MRPGGRIIGRIDGSQLRNQALPKDCRLFGGENGSCGTHGGLAAIPGAVRSAAAAWPFDWLP